MIILGDFNAEISDSSMESFCSINNLKCIIKEPTCYKNPDNPTCIDLILTNCPKNFQESSTLETGLSDFHKMVLTVFKSEAPNLTPKVVSYRKYKLFDSDKFKLEVSDKLSMQDLSTMDYKNFKDTIIDSLNKHAPLKRKYLRANHSNFITKELSKAIMQRSKLRNLYLKVRSDENRIRYKKQRNICVSLLRKAKRKHFEDLSIADVTDNKKFWKRVKPLFGNKIKGNPNIALVESNDLITDEKSLAETFNNYFVNVVSNLGINILDDKSGKGGVSNYYNHPSIITIKQHITDKNKNKNKLKTIFLLQLRH